MYLMSLKFMGLRHLEEPMGNLLPLLVGRYWPTPLLPFSAYLTWHVVSCTVLYRFLLAQTRQKIDSLGIPRLPVLPPIDPIAALPSVSPARQREISARQAAGVVRLPSDFWFL